MLDYKSGSLLSYHSIMESCCSKEMECGKGKEKCSKEICEKECKKGKKKCFKKMKLEMKVAIGVLAPELNPMQQGIMFYLFKKIVKKMIKGKCKEMCKDKCPTECSMTEKCEKKCKKDMKKAVMKNFQSLARLLLGEKKAHVLSKMQVVLDAFTKVTGKPIGGEPEKCKGPKKIKKFLKKVAKAMYKMHDKGITIKNCQEKFAEKFWEKIGKDKFKKFMKKSKKLAKKIVFYHCAGCEELAQKGVIRILAQTLFAFGMAMFLKKMSKKGSCGKGPEEAPTSGPGGKCHKFGMMKGKKCKKMFKKCILMGAIKIGVEFLNDNKEIAMTCLNIAKNVTDEYLSTNPAPCAEKFRKKIIPRMVAAAIKVSAGEKKPDEFYLDFCKRYISGKSFLCKKKCIKCCVKLAKSGLLFQGVKCKCKTKVASRWAALMCCRANYKEGCPKDVCAEFFNKWFKDYMPAVEEGFKAIDELKEEFKAACGEECAKEEGKEKCGGKCGSMKEKIMCKLMTKLLLSYLEMYCQDGKFNKEEFKKMMKDGKEGMKKCMEKYMKKCCPMIEKCGMPEEKK